MHSAALPISLYLWDRRFLLRAQSFVTPRRAKPHKRLSVTILIAAAKRFTLEIGGQAPRAYQGVILGPNVPRSFFEGPDSDLTLIDAGITTAAYRKLVPALRGAAFRALDEMELRALRPLLSAPEVALDCGDAARLFDEVVRTLAGDAPANLADPDSRVGHALRLIDELPLDELSLPRLARATGVSPSRLRELFQQGLGCGPAQYMRWASAWKAMRLWQRGMTLTDLAHQIGFHDLAHIDHAIAELFGISPSTMTTAKGVSFHQCRDG